MDSNILEHARIETNRAIERHTKVGAAVFRLTQIEIELKITEPEAAAQYDLITFWLSRIKKAMDEGKASVDNYPWIWFARTDPQYVLALRELLGTQFQVTWREGLFGNQYTQISW